MHEHEDAAARGADDALRDFAARVRGLDALTKLNGAAVEALDAFKTAGVDSLLLKGPVLARMLYSAGEHRGYSDVDLLVAPGDFAGARRSLLDLGYENVNAGWELDDVGEKVNCETWVRGDDLMIDLHWRMDGSRANPQVAWDALAARRTQIELAGRRVAVLDRDGLAMHVATHAAHHGPRVARPIRDLVLGLEHWPPDVWRGAARLADEIQATEAFAAGLRLVPAGAALASVLGLPATDELDWTIRHEHERPRGTFHLRAFAEARSLRERAAVLRRSLLPTREYIVYRYWWAGKGAARLAAAYGLHLLRLPMAAARAWRFRRRARRAAR